MAFALLGGVISVNAQTDVTSTYLTNADFEGEYTVFSNPRNDGSNARAIYQPTGWTVTYTDGNENDMSCLNSDCLQWSQFSEQKQPSNGGNNTYWTRLRFGGNTKLVLSQTASVPAGTYSLSADAYKNPSNGVATISAAGKSVTIDGRSEWSNYTIVFTLTETTLVTFSYSFEGKATDTRIGIDNFKLVDITQGASDITAQDWTSMIANAGFESGSGSHSDNSVTVPYGYTMSQTMEGWKDGSINTTNPSEGSRLYNYWAGTTTSLDIYQTLQLPAGKYTITADLRTEAGKISNQGVYAKIGDETFKSSTIQTIGNPWNSVDAWNTLSQDFYVQSDGSVQVGASSTGGASSVGWFQIDNFTLSYKGAILNTPYSITPEDATAITNDKWYAVEISADGDYRIISSVANTVMYTQDGYKIPSDISTSVDLTAGVKQVVALTRGILYVKASTDAELTIEPDAYTYSVGDATKSVADNEYTQSNTITFTFADASTNDPSGALSILDASKIKVNSVDATATIEGNVLTVTLASPLATSTDYAVSIEAGAVGYNAENANAAISLTAKTPAVFDGTYFIGTTDGTQFISRGGDSNTEAVLDKYGIAVNITTDASNVTHFQFVDNDKNLFGGSSSIYTDKNESDLGSNAERARWTVASVSGGYTLYSGTWSKYIKAGTGAESDKPAATYDEAAYTWVLETPAAHQTKMAAYKDANAAAVATATSIAGVTTVAELETELGSNWTSSSVSPSNAYSSVTEKYQPNGYGENIFTQNLTGLKNGIYKVTLSIFHRIRDYATTYTLHQANADNPTAYLYANNQQVQLPSPLSDGNNDAYSSQDAQYGGKHYPNGMTAAGEAFTANKYKVTVYAVVTDGTLTIGVKDPGKYSNANWICWRDLAVTSYIFKGDYSSLATAIETVEGKLGFEDKEYAPYNNVANMAILNEAKALNSSRDAVNQDEIDDAEYDLTSASWNENDGDVDIIYNGNFAIANGTNPEGWTRSNGAWGQQITGLSAASNGVDAETTTAWYYNTNGAWEYGKDDVYKMPLAGSTTYKLTFKYRSHATNSNNWMKASVLNESDEGLAVVQFPRNTDATNFIKVTAYFTTGTSGNYILSIEQNGNTHLTDVTLEKAGSANYTLAEDNSVDLPALTYYETFTLARAFKEGWNAVCLPFATSKASLADGAKIYELTSEDADGDNITLNFTEAGSFEANKPYMVKLTSDEAADKVFSGVIVNPSDATTVGTAFDFKGVYTVTDIDAGNWVISGGELKKASTTIGLKPTRAYFAPKGGGGARIAGFTIDGDEATGLKAAMAEMGVEVDGIYNLKGQKVSGQLKKGIYVVNGKKVIK